MAEEARDSESPNEGAHEIESQIKGAMHSRVAHFKEQADSLTFEGVRRLLEKDLGLETYALDVHKRLIKQCLQECLDGADDDNASKTFGEMGEKGSPRGEVAEASDELHLKKDVNDSEDSPVMGLLTGHKMTKSGTEENEISGNNDAPSESTIKKAIRKRASYVKANSEDVTMAGLRRLLEGDLKLDKYTLDPYKKFISQQLDEVLQSHEVSEDKPRVNVKKNVKRVFRSKASKKVSSEESSDSSDSKGDEEEEEEEEVKPRKKSIPKGNMQKSDLTKRKKPAKETNVSNKKPRKAGETISEDNSDAEDGGHVSEDDNSQSSPEKPVKKKEVSNLTYGKRVEHLKSIIKSCGMSVPPSIYKKVKQVPENKREAHLIKELEEILSKEGLSANPSEKDIKDVRKKKERAKELEGIDMSNIVQSSRRRSAISFVAPPKPKIPVESEGDDAEDTEKDNDVDDDDEDDEDDEDDDDDEEDDDGSQSEEFNDDADEDSD